VREEFGKVRECLDVYHALEHLRGIGKLFYGEKSSAFARRQTGARWKVRNLNRILSLVTLRYSDTWEEYWHTAN